MMLAYILFQSIRGRSGFRMIFFLPYVTPVIATALVFRIIFSPRPTSLANQFLEFLGQHIIQSFFIPLPGLVFAELSANRTQIFLDGLFDLIPEFFIGNFQHPCHGFIIEIQNEVADKHNAITDLPGTGSRNFTVLDDQIIDRFVFSLDADSVMNIDDGL